MSKGTSGLTGFWLLWLFAVSLPAEPLRLRHYSTSNGLAHNHVNALQSDSRGFLWICTDEGLARFDGQRFKNYTRQNGVPHIHVNAIVETRDGEYWIATDNGIARFQPRRPGLQFESFALGSAPEAQFVNTLTEDRDGSLLAGSNGGLFRIARGNPVRIDPVPVPAALYPGVPSILQVRIDGKGQWCIGTENGLLRRGQNGRWVRLTEAQGLPSNFIGAIAIDALGRPWAGTKTGAVRLRLDMDEVSQPVDLVLTVRNGLPDPDVRAIGFARGGRVWFGTMNGLAEWEEQSGQVRVYHRTDGLADETVYAIAEDPALNLWFGTRRGGVMQLVKSEIETYGTAAGLAPSGDDTLLETVAGKVCVAAIADSRRPIDCLESGRFVRSEVKLPPDVVAAPTTSSQSTLTDRRGAWWISTPAGLFRFPPAPTRRQAVSHNFDLWLFRGLQCRRLLEDRAGNIWIETRLENHTGLAKWDVEQQRVIDFSAKLPQRADSVSALADDGKNLWLGFGRPGGLFRLRDEAIEQIPGVPSGTVNALHCDHRGHIWVATSDAGLAEVDVLGGSPPVRVYNAASHLSSDEVWCIAEDRLGRVYAGTARGVDQIDPVSGAVLHYSAEDGLAEGDIRSALRDRNGDLWFLSNQGLSHLGFSAEQQTSLPVPRLSQLRAGGKLELISEFGETQAGPLRLAPDQSSVEIDFLAVSQRTPWRLRYQYRLTGAADPNWGEPSATSSVRFPQLSPGDYRFEVRSTDGNRQFSAPAFVEFRLMPPIWRRAWFLAILLVVGASGIYVLHRYRLNQVLALERVRTRLATDLHDDLGAGLAEIAILSEVAKRKPGSAAIEMLDYVANRARTLRAALGDIVWTVDPTRDHVVDLVRRLRETALTMLEAEGRNIEFVAPTEQEVEGMDLPPDLRRHFFLFFREAVTNVARHAGATAVHLEVSSSGLHLRLVIRDNGRGFDPLAPTSGRGLESLRYRAAEMRAELKLKSSAGHGAEIELSAPLRT